MAPIPPGTNAAAALPPEFSLVRLGPFHRLLRAFGFGGDRLALAGVVLGLIAWLPLALLSTLQHLLMTGATVPFGESLGTHARFLLTIPLMFVAEMWFDGRVNALFKEFIVARIVPPPDVPQFAVRLRRAVSFVGAWPVEAALIVLTGIFLVAGVRTDLPTVVSTWRGSGGAFTWAGWWYAVVSMPLFQFLLWRWSWRLLVWGEILWRLARLNLQLVPTHPDLSGGLGGLGLTQVSLSALLFGLSGMMVASFAENVLHGGIPLERLVLPLAAIVVLGVGIVLLPLLFFAPKLLELKQRGRLQYGALASDYTLAFASKWIDGKPDEALLGSADIQSLADLSNSFEVIRSMRLVPCSLHDVVLLVLAMVIPMVPLLLIIVPLSDLIIRTIKMIVGIG